jgi:lipoprotein-anchoring transpeptidase ErfK/SrfK
MSLPSPGGSSPGGSRGRRVRRAGLTAAVALVLAGSAAACTSGSAGTGSERTPRHPVSSAVRSGTAPVSHPSTGASSAQSAPAVRLTAQPMQRNDVSPLEPITVTAKHGKLTKVEVVNEDGKVVKGAYSDDHAGWHTAEVLGYGRTYTVKAKAVDGTGESSTALHRVLHTVVPDNQTLPYLDTIYGTPLENGATYGIGMIPVVHFDESIPNRAAAEKALEVTTSPHVDGSWTWIDDSTLHWRPRHFYAPGTKVTINAKVYGKNFGTDSYSLYGQDDLSVSFNIGPSHVSIANDRTHRVKVFFNGKLKRTMLTSMGQHSGVTVKGNYINFWTPSGTYTVIGHENPAKMCSNTYGLPANAPGGYPCEKIPWSTKITVDGIYLHELDTTTWAQGHTDVSHGCLNLDGANAKWFYNHSLVGDVVKVIMPGGPQVQLWQGGDWTVPWQTWLANSALS